MQRVNNNIVMLGENGDKEIGISLDRNPCLLIEEDLREDKNKLSLFILKNIVKGFENEVRIYSISKIKYKNKSKLGEIDEAYDLIKELKVEAGLIKRKLTRAKCKSIREYNKKYPDLKINQNVVYIDTTSEIIRDIKPLENPKLNELRDNIKYLILNAKDLKIKFIIDICNHETIDKSIYEFLEKNCLLIRKISSDLYSIPSAEEVFHRS